MGNAGCGITVIESNSATQLTSSPTPSIHLTESEMSIQLNVLPAPVFALSLESSPQINLSLGQVISSPSLICWSNFGQGTPKQVQVTSNSTQLLNSNSKRVFVRISNNSTQSIYIQYGIDAIWKQGQVIMPNGVYIINTQELFTGVINAITNIGSVLIDVTEGII